MNAVFLYSIDGKKSPQLERAYVVRLRIQLVAQGVQIDCAVVHEDTFRQNVSPDKSGYTLCCKICFHDCERWYDKRRLRTCRNRQLHVVLIARMERSVRGRSVKSNLPSGGQVERGENSRVNDRATCSGVDQKKARRGMRDGLVCCFKCLNSWGAR